MDTRKDEERLCDVEQQIRHLNERITTLGQSPTFPEKLLVELAPKKKTFWDWSEKYASTIVAIAALGVAVYAGMNTRLHDRLSVRPAVGLFEYFRPGYQGQTGIFVENDGLGPAEVSNMRLYLDGKRLKDWDWAAIVDQSGKAFKSNDPKFFITRFYAPGRFVVRSGQGFPLFSTAVSNVQDDEACFNLMENRVFLIATVCSFYNECWTFCSKGINNCEHKEQTFLAGTSGTVQH